MIGPDGGCVDNDEEDIIGLANTTSEWRLMDGKRKVKDVDTCFRNIW